jgi:hypothetical protein
LHLLFQVYTLLLDVFCWRSAQIHIPQDLSYTPFEPGYSSAKTNVILLCHNPTHCPEFNEEFELAGFECVSVGFMQNVFELLTEPGDIVLDWAVGGGASFIAGNFLNRFVIGAEGRSKFYSFAKSSLQTVLDKDASKDFCPGKENRQGT